MTKKIGCVIAYTPGHTNYGTSLVGYALLKKIQMLGFDVEVINYIKRLTNCQKITFIINALRAGELKELLRRARKNKDMIEHPDYASNIRIRVDAVEAYKNKKLIPYFRNYVGYDNLHRGSKNYDTIVVGSDQVWTPMSLPNRFYNLLFVDDRVHKVAYASSFGVSIIPSFQKKKTGAYLDRFYRIGVREQKGKDIVETLSHQKATVVADPTMLLNAKEWEDEIFHDDINGFEVPNEPYIFSYFLGTNPESRTATDILKNKTGLKIISLRHMDEYYEEDEKFGDYAPYDVDPNGFLRLIHEAKYVCTDSFHCTAFCVQFHKQFMTFYRFAQSSSIGRNSRIDSLFNVLGMHRERIYGSRENGNDIFKITNAIDWDYVDRNLMKLRDDSVEFLKRSLE